MQLSYKSLPLILAAAAVFTGTRSVKAALLVYEPFTNAPVSSFLRPVPGGRLIDRGINVGDSCSGAALELGAAESL
jgi:hypothetical protein